MASKFLLEGKVWPGFAPPVEATPPAGDYGAAGDHVPAYVAESNDYGIQIVAIKDEQMPSGFRDTYAVKHKRHGVVAGVSGLLSLALGAMEEAQQQLDTALGGKGSSGAN